MVRLVSSVVLALGLVAPVLAQQVSSPIYVRREVIREEVSKRDRETLREIAKLQAKIDRLRAKLDGGTSVSYYPVRVIRVCAPTYRVLPAPTKGGGGVQQWEGKPSQLPAYSPGYHPTPTQLPAPVPPPRPMQLPANPNGGRSPLE
jgi:hypothetical protein